jgi:hypothetical protein
MKCIINIIERALDEWDFMKMILFKDPRRGAYLNLSCFYHSKLFQISNIFFHNWPLLSIFCSHLEQVQSEVYTWGLLL